MNLRATQQSLDELAEKFAIFAELDTIEKLRDVYLPKIKKFSENITELEESNIQVRESVKALDEGLSLKCNKAVVLAL